MSDTSNFGAASSPQDDDPTAQQYEPIDAELVQEAIVPSDQSAVVATPQGIAAFFLDESRRLRTFWRFMIFGIGFVIIQLSASIIAIGALLAYQLVTEGELGLQSLDRQGSNYVLLLELASLPAAILALALAVVCRVFVDRRSVSSMGLVGMSIRDGTRMATLAFGFGSIPILLGSCALIAADGFQLHAGTWSGGMLIMTVSLMLAAFHEEIIFRAYLLQNLLDIRKPTFGVLFTSVVFWLVHAGNPHAWSTPLIGVNLFGAGIALALAYLVGGNIWFPTLMHFAWNFMQGVVLSIPVSGIAIEGLVRMERNADIPNWITGGPFGFEASIVCTCSEIVVILALLILLRIRRIP